MEVLYGNNTEEGGQSSQQSWCGQRRSGGRGDRLNCQNIECYICDKYGHYTKDCYSKESAEDENKVDGIFFFGKRHSVVS